MATLKKRPVYLVVQKLDHYVEVDGELEQAQIIHGLRQTKGSADALQHRLEESGQEDIEVVKMFIVAE